MKEPIMVYTGRGCIGLAACALALGATSALADAPALSLMAVAINGDSIEPTNTVQASPGDVLECEIYGSNWSPAGSGLMIWQFVIGLEQFGGDDALVVPTGWDRAQLERPCTTDAECDEGDQCWHSWLWPLYCAGPAHDPEIGAYIDITRPDFVYPDYPPTFCDPVPCNEVVVFRSGFKYASFIHPVRAPLYTPPPKYFGTFTLEVLPDACGEYGMTLVDDPELTFFLDVDGLKHPVTRIEGLTIDTGACACTQPVVIDPPQCAIDARQPSRPDGSEPAGWDSITISFQDADQCRPFDITAEDFWVREVPESSPPPFIVGMIYDDSSVTINLNDRIKTGTWTCVMYNETGDEFCIAHLPGDVNGDRTCAPADILYVIDCLNNVATCEIHQCDTDRSGVCGPPDILRVIDLLNGAGVYEPWLNRRLQILCPSAP